VKERVGRRAFLASPTNSVNRAGAVGFENAQGIITTQFTSKPRSGMAMIEVTGYLEFMKKWVRTTSGDFVPCRLHSTCKVSCRPSRNAHDLTREKSPEQATI